MAKHTQPVGVPTISVAKRRGVPIRKSGKKNAVAETVELPAKPYDPTEEEKVALAKFDRQLAKRSPMPALKLDKPGPVSQLAFEHPDSQTAFELQSLALGTRSKATYLHLLNTLSGLTFKKDAPDVDAINAALSMIAGIEPNDQLENMLATQMVAVHLATLKTATRLKNADSVQLHEMYERAFNRLARTFAAQIEALKRYRSKGEQRMYIERVNVEQGGQAIVGNVSRTGSGVGGDDDESDR